MPGRDAVDDDVAPRSPAASEEDTYDGTQSDRVSTLARAEQASPSTDTTPVPPKHMCRMRAKESRARASTRRKRDIAGSAVGAREKHNGGAGWGSLYGGLPIVRWAHGRRRGRRSGPRQQRRQQQQPGHRWQWRVQQRRVEHGPVRSGARPRAEDL